MPSFIMIFPSSTLFQHLFLLVISEGIPHLRHEHLLLLHHAPAPMHSWLHSCSLLSSVLSGKPDARV